ncbi:MAG: hypothetical protein WCJ58_03690 [bacterium]
MLKYENIITIKETNLVLDLILGLIVVFSFFSFFNTQVSAFVKGYLDFSPYAEFNFLERTNQNQTTIEIINKRYVDNIFFNGIASRDKLTVTLEEGENNFLFVLSGRGKEIEKKISIVKDTKAPEFTTAFQFKDTKINTDSLLIEGELNEPSKVTINSKDCLTLEDKVKCELNISGDTDVIFLVTDLAGNNLEKKFKVTIDKTAPTLEINSENPTFQEKVAITIKGNEELSIATVKGLEAKRIDESTFSFEVSLNIGKNDFEIIGKDNAGNETKQNYSVERKEAPKKTSNNSNNNNTNNNTGGNTNPSNSCSSVSIKVSNVQTPVFPSETQTATVQLTCGNGSGYSVQTINLSVKYSNGVTKSYSKTTNGSGIADFSFPVEAIGGSTVLTASYSSLKTSVTFQVTN